MKAYTLLLICCLTISQSMKFQDDVADTFDFDIEYFDEHPKEGLISVEPNKIFYITLPTSYDNTWFYVRGNLDCPTEGEYINEEEKIRFTCKANKDSSLANFYDDHNSYWYPIKVELK